MALIGFASVWVSQPDYDYWWHLASGRYMVSTGRLPVPDVFSYTASGRHWIAHEWLSEVLMFRLHAVFGVAGPLAFFGLCLAALVLLSFATLGGLRVRPLPAATLVGLLILALWPYVGPRPQVGAFALMAAVIWLVERWLRRRDRSIWTLPVLIWLWGNLHGSFAVGLAVPALLLVAEIGVHRLGWRSAGQLARGDRRRLALNLGASVLLLLLNPNGPSLLLYPFTKLDNPLLQYLGEWGATDISQPNMWPFALLLGGYFLLHIVRRPPVKAAEALLAMSFGGAALWSARFVPFASLVLIARYGHLLAEPTRSQFALPPKLQQGVAWCQNRARPYAHPTGVQQALNLVVLLGVAAFFVVHFRPYREARDTRLPVAAVNQLGAAGLSGPLFHDYNWGGYLIWRLWPAERVFIDGRGDDLYTSGGELRHYLDIIYLRQGGEGMLERYDVQGVLFLKDTPLTRYLLVGGRWHTVYDDGRVVLLRRS